MLKHLFRPHLVAISLLCILALKTSEAQGQHPISAEAEYTWLHANILPNCNCFSMQGGGGEVEAGLTRHLAVLVDITATHADNLTPSKYDLTQSVFTAGLRYTPPMRHFALHPFGEVLLGAAHASGTLAPSYGNYGSDNAFALQTGGGVRIRLADRWTLIPIHADYLLTTFNNGADNRQNQLRLSAGIQFKLHQ